MLKMGWIISPYTVKQAAFDLEQKETGSKTVALATSKYTSCGEFLSVQSACQIPISLHHYLQSYSLFCVLTSIMSHLMTSSVPNLHNTKILNISGTRSDTTKTKTTFIFTFKGLSNSPIFQYLNFSFHRHFKVMLRISLVSRCFWSTVLIGYNFIERLDLNTEYCNAFIYIDQLLHRL